MINKHRLTLFAILFIVFLVSLYFWKSIIYRYLPFPGDMLVGAYYPWHEQNWGYSTGVPIKNPYITDTFSQIYIWKELIIQSYKKLQWPLWNQYSYSGYPLLANFQSGALNPFNIIFLIFGQKDGWSVFCAIGIFLSCLSMFLYLRSRYRIIPSLISAISYGFSGFSLLWMLYANANYSLAILPILLLLVDKYILVKKSIYLFLMSIALFCLVIFGHLQLLIFGTILFVCYFIYRCHNRLALIPVLILFLGLSAIQLLPSLEMWLSSIRNQESFIASNNYGLIPLRQLITIIAPDFFGNQSTFNYWGSFNYHETNFYPGIIAVLALIWSLTHLSKSNRFFVLTAIIAILLGFDTVIGKLPYLIGIPAISTSAAGRISSIFSLSTCVLIPSFLESISATKKHYSKSIFILLLFLIIVVISILISQKIHYFPNLQISFRNIILPTLFVSVFVFSLRYLRRVFWLIIVFIVVFDLFRFGWKVTPFVSKNLVYPTTSIIDFIKKDPDIFRIERPNGPIFPPNTWTAYKLMSPSGYDPLSNLDYVKEYNRQINNNQSLNPQVSRYTELYHIDSKSLGEFNVKYLMLLSSDDKNLKDFKLNSWTLVFQTPALNLYQNKDYRPRIEITNTQATAKIINYQANHISIEVKKAPSQSSLILRDSFYPGWLAYINGKLQPITRYNQVYRQVNLPSGDSQIYFIYNPKSFRLGQIITFFSVIIITALILIYRKR